MQHLRFWTKSCYARMPWRQARTAAIALLAVIFLAAPVSAQTGSRAVPREDYVASFRPYYEGEFQLALRAFQSSAKSGVRSTEGRWVDSICYHAMIGECYYQMGDLKQSLEQHTSALRLFLAHRDWMLRVEFPPAIDPSARQLRITWGQSLRNSIVGRFPDTMISLQGRLDNSQVVQQGGVVAPAQFYPVRVPAIVRCTSLSLRRRRVLLGPACAHAPLTAELITALSRNIVPPNHWSQAWIDCQLGIAYASTDKTEQAVAFLQRSVTAAGQFDHPLSSMALLELGNLAFAQDSYDIAARYYLEATFAAAAFSQYDVMAEAFRRATEVHLVSGQKGVYPPLANATAWARRESRYLEAVLLTLAAENFSAIGDNRAASVALDQAGRSMNRREMSGGAVGARWQFASALVQFQAGNVSGGTAAFNNALAYQRNSSLRLFQIAMADALAMGGTVSDRVGDLLYTEVLREPTARDWSVDPLETFAVILTLHPLPLEHWLEVALVRKEIEKAIQISDRIRRHRFFSTLPMGGRLNALRWILESPPAELNQVAALQQQDLLLKYPNYAALATDADKIAAQLKALPLVSDDDEIIKQQKELYSALATTSTAQELILRDIALRRIPSEFVFPPRADIKQLQEALPENSAVLSFLQTSRNTYGFVISKQNYSYWPLESLPSIRKQLGELLRDWGNRDGDHVLSTGDVQNDAWQEDAASLLAALTGGAKPEVWDALEEVIIVPDGFLWYVPFEALPTNNVSLIDKVRIRYVPTVSLALPDRRGKAKTSRTLLVSGKLFPRESDEFLEEATADLRLVLPQSEVVRHELPIPSGLLSTQCQQVLVMADMAQKARGPYDLAPLQLDAGKAGSSVANWMSLPWGSPAEVVLSGFHTPAENAFKDGGDGSEIFLTVCGLMSTGTRTILLSRWRVGGQSTYDLTREFAQELPHSTAAAAWQRSIRLLRQTNIDATREYRVHLNTDDDLLAKHPFFWSSYLLIDTARTAP